VPFCFPWSLWGPQNTTWFLGDCRQSLYGFRTVGFIDDFWSPEPRRLCIRDFNPHNICDYGTGGETGQHGRLVRGRTTTTIISPFTEPLGYALPYREIISEELQVDASWTIMDNSSVLLSKASHNLCFGPSAYDQLWQRGREESLEKVEVLIFWLLPDIDACGLGQWYSSPISICQNVRLCCNYEIVLFLVPFDYVDGNHDVDWCDTLVLLTMTKSNGNTNNNQNG
jgi:hypothetical protein